MITEQRALEIAKEAGFDEFACLSLYKHHRKELTRALNLAAAEALENVDPEEIYTTANEYREAAK